MGRAELVLEVKDAVGVGFRGVKVVFGAFEQGKVFNGEVFWEAFDRKVGKIVGHSIELWRLAWRVLICAGSAAD